MIASVPYPLPRQGKQLTYDNQGSLKKLAEYTRKSLNEIARRKTRRDMYAMVNQSWYNGEHYWYPHRTQSRIETDKELFLGGYKWNKMATSINMASAIVGSVSYRAKAMPIGDDIGDLLAAQVPTAILADHAYRNNRHATDRLISQGCLMGGDEFVRVGFDPRQAATVVMSKEELVAFINIAMREGFDPRSLMSSEPEEVGPEEYRVRLVVGGTTEHRIPAELVFPDDCADFSQCVRYRTVEYIPVLQLKQMFPNASGEIKPLSHAYRRSAFVEGGSSQIVETPFFSEPGDQLGERFDETSGRGMATYIWEKNDSGTWDYACFLNDDMSVVAEDPQLSVPLNPLIHFKLNSRGPHWMWGKSMGDDLHPLNFALDKLCTHFFRALPGKLKDTWIASKGSKISRMSNAERQVLTYDGLSASAPQFMSPQSTLLAEYMNAINFIVSHMDDTANLSPESRGFGGERLSGKRVQASAQAASTPLRHSHELLKPSFLLRDEVVLAIAKEKYKLPRLLVSGSKFNEAAVRVFKGTDVRMGTLMQLEEDDLSSDGMAFRMEVATSIQNLGLFMPGMEQQRDAFFRYLHTGNLESLRTPEERVAEKVIMDQLRLLRMTLPNGQPRIQPGPPEVIQGPQGPMLSPEPGKLVDVMTRIPLFNPGQAHPHFVRYFRLEAQKPNTPIWLQQLLEMAAQEHERFLQQLEEMNIQKQLQTTAQQSVAEAQGNLAVTMAAMEAKAQEDQKNPIQGTPQSGGRESGKTRRDQAA